MPAPTLAGGGTGWSLRQAIRVMNVERRAAQAALNTGLLPPPPLLSDEDLLPFKTLTVLLKLGRSDFLVDFGSEESRVLLKESDRAARYAWNHPGSTCTLVVTDSAARLAETDPELCRLVGAGTAVTVLLPLSTWGQEIRARQTRGGQ